MRITFVVITLLAALLIPAVGQTQEPNRAGLAVQFPDGHVETACIAFTEDDISGADLLARSGLLAILDYSDGLGAKVCKIGETGCNYPGEDCWCQCQGSPCAYWNYWVLQDDRWTYSPLGASSRHLNNGDVDGWAWGDGQLPPQTSLDEICQGGIGTTTAFTSPLQTPTPRPTAIQTPQPTATSPASPLSPPTAVTQPPASPTAQVYIPATSGKSPTSPATQPDLPPSTDRYVGFAGILAALGLIALTVWRRRKGV
jgi:MYXO-CTERM domain-containing protein